MDASALKGLDLIGVKNRILTGINIQQMDGDA